MKNPVHAVTIALVDAGLAFWFSPYHSHLPHGSCWFLEFEGDHEERLWLEEGERRLVLASLVPREVLGPRERFRDLDDGISLSRGPDSTALAIAWLPIGELEGIKERAYALLSVVKRAKKSGAKKSRTKKSRTKTSGAKEPGAKKSGARKSGAKKSGVRKSPAVGRTTPKGSRR